MCFLKIRTQVDIENIIKQITTAISGNLQPMDIGGILCIYAYLYFAMNFQKLQYKSVKSFVQYFC